MYPFRRARSIASSVSLTVPIWLTLIRIELATPLSIPSCRNCDVGHEQIVADQLNLAAKLPWSASAQPSQSFSASPSSSDTIG